MKEVTARWRGVAYALVAGVIFGALCEALDLDLVYAAVGAVVLGAWISHRVHAEDRLIKRMRNGEP